MLKRTTQKRANGTSLVGYVDCTYQELEELFGEPYKGTDKTTAEWVLTNGQGVVVTVYDYKYYGDPKVFTQWHIGGNSSKAVLEMQHYFATARKW